MLAVLGLLALGSARAFAADGSLSVDKCHVPPDHGIYSDDGKNTLISCITQEAWANAQANASSTQNLPTFRAGAKITDEHGVSDSCPSFYFMGCVDYTRTAQYRSYMNNVAKQLIGYTGSKVGAKFAFPVFSGWIDAQ